jgi:hypothetical protein
MSFPAETDIGQRMPGFMYAALFDGESTAEVELVGKDLASRLKRFGSGGIDNRGRTEARLMFVEAAGSPC